MDTKQKKAAELNLREQAARMKVPSIIAANQPTALLTYAQSIAIGMARTHYASSKSNFEPYGDLFGVLEQIDNMAAGLVRGTPRQLENLRRRRFQRTYGQK
jgi:hypothetical protein